MVKQQNVVDVKQVNRSISRRVKKDGVNVNDLLNTDGYIVVVFVSYRWEKDGEIPETTLGVKMRKGVLTIEGYFSHAGRYRCFASNQWGVALTDFIDVRMATLSRPKDTDVSYLSMCTVHLGRWPF